jgi:hypothetical protein
LLLRAYREDDEYLDEMYTVIHAVEGFPTAVFIEQFLLSIDELSSSSPYLLTLLCGRILNSQACTQQLMGVANKADVQQRKRVVDAINRAVEAYPDWPAITRNAQATLAGLKQ